MVKRKIIRIDEETCNGCGTCIPNCPEGAIQIIDGKARIISDIFCDGLGACIGHCPNGSISIEERDAEPYDEKKVMQDNIIKAGKNTIIAHLKHLKEHGEKVYLKQALDVLNKQRIQINFDESLENTNFHPEGCPGAKTIDFSAEKNSYNQEVGNRSSKLRHWPIQLHLINPNTSYFQGSDVILAADCVAYSYGDFHKDFLKGKSLVIACPKLDVNQEIYIEKIQSMIENAKINTLTVITMQVPCCNGLLYLVKKAMEKTVRKIPIKNIIVGIKGELLKNEWI